MGRSKNCSNVNLLHATASNNSSQIILVDVPSEKAITGFQVSSEQKQKQSNQEPIYFLEQRGLDDMSLENPQTQPSMIDTNTVISDHKSIVAGQRRPLAMGICPSLSRIELDTYSQSTQKDGGSDEIDIDENNLVTPRRATTNEQILDLILTTGTANKKTV